MKLIIVESPAKAKTLTKYLKGFKVIASMGHIRDLPADDFGVDVDNDFAPTYQVIEGKEKTVKMIQKEAAAAEEIYLGSDPDREGEAIAYHVASFLQEGKPVHRVLFHEITKNGVLKAIDERTALNENLYNAQQARRILDRIVGYRLSPFLWKSVKKGLSAGRVQSVALKFLVDRERDIRSFVPEEYWTIKSLFEKAGGLSVDMLLDKTDGQKAKISNEAEALEIERRIRAATGWLVETVEQKRKKENPLPPFNTSSLQQEASRLYHYTADRIMRIAQGLYEGKEIGEEGPVGLITYMRTDSFRISPEVNAKLRSYVVAEFGENYLAGYTRTYENKKGKIQDAHEAIRPTDVNYTPDKVKQFLTKEELNVYTLIWRRFVATQMKEAEFDQTVVQISDTAHTLSFKKSGSVMVFDGFRKMWDRTGNGRDEQLPAFIQGETLVLNEVTKEQNFTKPPARYTEGSLVKELEEKGIGRPSTYAAIINHIIARKYIERLKEPKGALGATDLGGLVSDTLQQFFPKIINVNFTADMEEKLDLIEAGEAQWIAVLKEFYATFELNRSESLETLKESGKKRIYAEENCPKCGARLIVRFSKKGNHPFLSCEKYPECTFSGDMVKEGEKIHLREGGREEPQILDEKCPNCGAPLAVKQGRFGPFKACSNYPKCKTIVREAEVFGPCPKEGCGGTIEKRRSKKGKVFFGCSNYPKCDFVSWYPPIAGLICVKCGAAYMVEKKSGIACGICGEKVKS